MGIIIEANKQGKREIVFAVVCIVAALSAAAFVTWTAKNSGVDHSIESYLLIWIPALVFSGGAFCIGFVHMVSEDSKKLSGKSSRTWVKIVDSSGFMNGAFRDLTVPVENDKNPLGLDVILVPEIVKALEKAGKADQASAWAESSFEEIKIPSKYFSVV